MHSLVCENWKRYRERKGKENDPEKGKQNCFQAMVNIRKSKKQA
jgi:hypothetical protein